MTDHLQQTRTKTCQKNMLLSIVSCITSVRMIASNYLYNSLDASRKRTRLSHFSTYHTTLLYGTGAICGKKMEEDKNMERHSYARTKMEGNKTVDTSCDDNTVEDKISSHCNWLSRGHPDNLQKTILCADSVLSLRVDNLLFFCTFIICPI